MKHLILILFLLLSTKADAQDYYTVNNVQAALTKKCWYIEKQCREYESCNTDSTHEYYIIEPHNCINDTCIYFVLRLWGIRKNDLNTEFWISAHNPALRIKSRKHGTDDIFLVDYSSGNDAALTAEIKMISNKKFVLYGNIYDEKLVDYIYYKQVLIPIELSEFIKEFRNK